MTAPDGDKPTSVATAQILTPGDWIELDLDPTTRHRSIRRAVRWAVKRDPTLRINALALIRLLDNVSHRAYESGAFYCASLVVDGDANGLLVANMLMQICGAALTSDAALSEDASATQVCAGLAASISVDPDWAGAEVSVVALPFVGPAVRISLVCDAVIVQYVVPTVVLSAQVVMTFTCACPPFVATTIDLFDAMASSLVLKYTA